LRRLAGCTRPVAGKSALLIITRGAKLMKPAPRSGSTTMTRVMVNEESPSSSGWPICRFKDTSSAASTQAVPGAGISRVGASAAVGDSATRRLPRSG